MAQQTVEIFRIKSDSQAVKVATSITKSVAQGNAISMRVIGAAALNEAVKAAIIAGQFMNKGVTMRPAFEDVEIDERTRTAIILDLTIEADASNDEIKPYPIQNINKSKDVITA